MFGLIYSFGFNEFEHLNASNKKNQVNLTDNLPFYGCLSKENTVKVKYVCVTIFDSCIFY